MLLFTFSYLADVRNGVFQFYSLQFYLNNCVVSFRFKSIDNVALGLGCLTSRIGFIHEFMLPFICTHLAIVRNVVSKWDRDPVWHKIEYIVMWSGIDLGIMLFQE